MRGCSWAATWPIRRIPDGSRTLFAPLTRTVGGAPCLHGSIDTIDLQPDAPGLQPDCHVDFVYDDHEEPVPRCPEGFPCWRVEEDPATCYDTPSQLILHLEREVYDYALRAIEIRCAGCPPP